MRDLTRERPTLSARASGVSTLRALGLVLAGLSTVAAGCRSVSLARDPNVTEAPARDQRLFEVDWWQRLVSPPFLEFSPREPAAPAVDAETGRVFAATRDGMVRSLLIETGEQEWVFKTLAPFSAGPAVKDGVVYVPGGDGNLYALRATTGTLIWKYAAGEELATVPVVTRDRVLVATHSDAVICVELSSGKWLWQYRRDPPSGFTIRGASTPLVHGDLAYSGFSDGHVVALRLKDGSTQWERSLAAGGPGRQFLDVDAAPLIDSEGKALYVASYQDGLFALDPKSGDLLWQTARTGVTAVVQQAGILLAAGEGGVSAFSSESGRMIWSHELGGRAGMAPALSRGHLLVPTEESLLFVDPLSGRSRAAWDPGRGVSATPSASGSRVFVLSNLGVLYALSVHKAG